MLILKSHTMAQPLLAVSHTAIGAIRVVSWLTVDGRSTVPRGSAMLSAWQDACWLSSISPIAEVLWTCLTSWSWMTILSYYASSMI